MRSVSLRRAVLLLVGAAFSKRGLAEDIPDFNWTSITPSRDLKYHECYNGYRCARLQVPLDWTEPDNASSSWAVIGIATLPAVVPSTDPSFGGTVLINPGGPGGAGTEMVLLFGKYLQGILDGEKHYEILGFDPRGIGRTTPSASCYTDDLNRLVDAVQQGGMPLIGSGDVGLNLHYQAAVGFGQLCGQQNLGRGNILAHMSTASVARDMLEIVERVDSSRNSGRGNSTHKAQLQYFGVSYGTYLGNTFATMFPDRVGRMVLDSVADAGNFSSGSWRKNLDDTEAVADYFYQTCFDAGASCPLRQGQDQSAANVRKLVDKFIRSLETNPVPAVQGGRVRLLTSGGGLCTRLAPTHVPLDCPWCSEATFGVLCGDSAATAAQRVRSVSWAREEARILLTCVDWQFAPKDAFSGPFESSVPLLILSNRYDPATPLANAYALSRQHRGSAVVVQESYGHATVLTSTSNCTAGIIREYFSSGKLPANGTSSAANCAASIPFKSCPGLLE
ncbi:Alpha/Beta hydrolase protein [Lasiosphaeris hirsuta]|uniref:Alpha/Beta hydrolase protein n=1 Tax=Lasiosphaeris hirsuta TaxID=260670 RepID=A0AA40AHK4_9PEZI|nr:Alpha/Beta hydrolase protein [Lasiosphaeris hirsuta]